MRTTILAVVSGILGSICCIGIPSLSIFSAYLVKLEFLRPQFVVYIIIIDYKPLNAQTKSVKAQQENGYPISVGGTSCADCIEHIKNDLMKLEEVKDVHYDSKNSVFYISIKEGFKFQVINIKVW